MFSLESSRFFGFFGCDLHLMLNRLSTLLGGHLAMCSAALLYHSIVTNVYDAWGGLCRISLYLHFSVSSFPASCIHLSPFIYFYLLVYLCLSAVISCKGGDIMFLLNFWTLPFVPFNLNNILSLHSYFFHIVRVFRFAFQQYLLFSLFIRSSRFLSSHVRQFSSSSSSYAFSSSVIHPWSSFILQRSGGGVVRCGACW